jgi:Ca2+/H+ antiporter
MYVPQSIIFDEAPIGTAIRESVSFWKKNFSVSFGILVISTIALFLIMIIEFVLDIFGFPGSIVSFVLVLIFLVPFVEQMKSYAYILKNELIRAPEVSSAKHHKVLTESFERSTRLREKHPKGKI